MKIVELAWGHAELSTMVQTLSRANAFFLNNATIVIVGICGHRAFLQVDTTTPYPVLPGTCRCGVRDSLGRFTERCVCTTYGLRSRQSNTLGQGGGDQGVWYRMPQYYRFYLTSTCPLVSYLVRILANYESTLHKSRQLGQLNRA